MSSHEWQKIEEVFEAALAVPADQRRAWLLEHCGEDVGLCSEVESLLAAEAASANFLPKANLARAVGALLSDSEEAREGQRIGPYKILREIGRGGMGVVYLAERDDEKFRQLVAIKVVKRGLDTEDILRRFHNERQILASLHHPNIAQLFDGGETADGRPYFVMEYIIGLSLMQYCDQHNLSINERLQIFRRICSGVHHAHQNLVIHRDLKPSNIIVARDGESKLLDFGVAKLLNSELIDGGVTQTQALQRVMTPEYASPEQVRGTHITTATDVYSLGIILYELLTGTRPYNLKDSSPAELTRVICDSEPSKPSEVAGKSELPAPAFRSRRKQNLLAGAGGFDLKSLRGDLDNIVLKALKKEPERRYKSVEQFSEDICRYLEGQPVIARRDTFAYRASKLIKRNKTAVAAASLIFLTLIGGIVATAWQASKAREQAALADVKTAEAQVASAQAQTALTKMEKINRFMQTIFAYANPDWFGRASGRRDMTVLEAMHDIENRIEDDFSRDPDLRADVYQQIGDSYRTQGLFNDAERNLRKALSLRMELYGEDNAKVAESMFILSGVHSQQNDFAEQERLLTKALNIQRRHPLEGNNLPYMIMDYAILLEKQKNDYAAALPLASEALEMFRSRFGESHYMVGAAQQVIVQLYYQLGAYTRAEAIAEEHLQTHPEPDYGLLGNYATLKIVKGDYQGAENVIGRMIAMAQSQDTELTPNLWMIPNLYSVQVFRAYSRGDYAQALAYAEKLLVAKRDNNGDSQTRAFTLSPILNKLGKTHRAEAILREAIEELRLTERVLDIALLKSLLGESLTLERRFAEAEPLLLEAHEMQKSRVLPQEYYLIQTRQRLAALYRAWGRAAEAHKYE